MNYAELIEQSNARVLELNKAARELEVVSARLDEISKDGNYFLIGRPEGEPMNIHDIIAEDDAKRIMVEIIKAVADHAADKQRRMEELLGIRPCEPTPVKKANDWEPLENADTSAQNAQEGPYNTRPINVPKSFGEPIVVDSVKREKITGTELNNMFEAGCSNDEIYEATGLKMSSVERYRSNFNKYGNAQGIKREPDHTAEEKKQAKKMDVEEISKMIKAGTPLKDIAVYYNVSKPDVYQFCKKHKIPTKKECAR